MPEVPQYYRDLINQNDEASNRLLRFYSGFEELGTMELSGAIRKHMRARGRRGPITDADIKAYVSDECDSS
jgi:hypothetical protein